MYIELDKVGKIKNACVNITGLTVIAGPNECGKSTVGKTLYALIKSVNESDKIFMQYLKNRIEMICRNVVFDIQQHLNNKEDSALLRDEYERKVFEMPMQNFINSNEYESALNFVIDKIKSMEKFKTLKIDDKERSVKFLTALRTDIENGIDKSKRFNKSLNILYMNIFKGQVNNSISRDDSYVSLKMSDNNVISYKIINNSDMLEFSDRLSVIDFSNEFIDSIFQDATFIETPLILQASQDIKELWNLKASSTMPHYWIDLLEKLTGDIKPPLDYCKEIQKIISDIVGGDFVYDTDIQRFIFQKENSKYRIDINNIASGTKCFGVIQMLAKYNLLNPNHLLILDEPENHLHPVWQVKLAQIIIGLIKNGISILLTTHSPYLLNALRDFSKRENIWQTKARFYFAQNIDGIYSSIIDASLFKDEGEENIIFESLYQAYESIDNDANL
ncbi:MAG: ATP-binding protein [Elusimicrobiota bacterium]|jgi:predicted ATPase|nr:ATP-binding protein [Elusimicrobiota bacterium]